MDLLPVQSNSFKKIALFSVAGLVLILIAGYLIFLSAPRAFPRNIIVNIEKGESLGGISKKLEEERLIRSRSVFKFFVLIFGGEKRIGEGPYFFEGQMPVFEVARRIAFTDRHLAPIKVVIPEGFTVFDIAEALGSQLPGFDKDKFLSEARGKEGYLFPDTYFFFYGDNGKDALKRFGDNFKDKIRALKPRIDASGHTEKEIITMASIVEREARGDDDRNMIAGVLWKRISLGMPLQTDAAPETYRRKGLPESPIANPGLESIEASLAPENSPFLFYLHDKNGIIYYARDFAEHKRNIAKYLK